MENSKEEILGRLFIWHDAIHRANQSLKIAFRVKTTKEEMEDINSTSFPTYYECTQMYIIAVEYAIIAFSTIYNFGFEDSGKAAKNDSNFREAHLNLIIDNIISESSERDRYNELTTSILKSRNEMIGHSDGQAFDVDHRDSITLVKMTHHSWKELDLIYWQSKLEPLRIEILKYSSNFKS